MATMKYTNYRGETSIRNIEPISVWFGRTDFHKEHQWLLTARDLDKGANRDFALKDCDFTYRPEDPNVQKDQEGQEG